jgi:hypothetical protein
MTTANGFHGVRNLSKGIPVERTNLTAKERALLPDPQWVTEDDADAIMSMREEKKAAGRSYSLEQVLSENGLTLERSNPARRSPATAPARRRRQA